MKPLTSEEIRGNWATLITTWNTDESPTWHEHLQANHGPDEESQSTASSALDGLGQPGEVLAGPGPGQHRLQRGAGLVHLLLQVLAIGRKAEADVAGKIGDGLGGEALVEAHAAEQDGDLGPA